METVDSLIRGLVSGDREDCVIVVSICEVGGEGGGPVVWGFSCLRGVCVGVFVFKGVFVWGFSCLRGCLCGGFRF